MSRSSSSGFSRDELEGQGRHRHLVAARIPGQLDLRNMASFHGGLGDVF
jgi:hypothetical protein